MTEPCPHPMKLSVLTMIRIMPLIGTGFFAIGALVVVNSVLTYLPDAFPTEIPSVMAGNAFIRFSFGAGFPLFAPAMYHNLGIHWASSLLGFLGLAFVPIPFAFYFVSPSPWSDSVMRLRP